ncbi:MAG: ribonuclease P protein component [Planctomycetota bacterium]
MNPNFGHPPSHRLKQKRAFDALFSGGTRVHGRFVTVIARPGTGASRLGIPCGKRYSKHAVERNRFRRLVREVYRLQQNALPSGLEMIVLPRCKPKDTKFESLSRELPQLIQRAAGKVALQAAQKAAQQKSE